MSKENFPDLTPNGRYYANPIEQQILVQGLQRYFSLPERSQNRNKIAKEISTYLRRFSPHWSHRAVRLWFNNNKHTYFGNSNEGIAGTIMNPNLNPNMNMNPNFNMNPNININPNFNTNLNVNLNPSFGINPNININPSMNINPNVNINPNMNANPNMNINSTINMNASLNMGVNMQNQPIVNPVSSKIIVPPKFNQTPAFSDSNKSTTINSNLNSELPIKKKNDLPIPIKLQASTTPNAQKPSYLTVPLIDEKAKQPPPPKINSNQPQNSSSLPQSKDPSQNATYPIINSPIYHSTAIPPPQIQSDSINRNQTSIPQQSLPEPQINKIKSPIKISSPVQVVSPRQAPDKIPLTLPPIKVSEISQNSSKQKADTINFLNNITINSSRNISSSPSIEGKNIVSSPITSQKYIMRPPIQVGSKVLFPPVQLENDYSVNNLNNSSSPTIPFSKSLTIEPTIDQSYANLARLLKNIQDTDENDLQLEQKITEFDNCINSLKSRCYNIEIDRIEPRLKSTRFPFSREPSTDFNIWNQIPESNSNLDILSDFPMRSPSFSHQLFYATDNASVGHGDSFTSINIWQVRNFTDKKVPYFECTAFSDEIAAYVHLQLQNQNQRVLSIYNYRTSGFHKQNRNGNNINSQNNADFYNINNLNNNNDINNVTDSNSSRAIDRQWVNILIDSNSRVEAMSINSYYAWLLADGFVMRTSLSQTFNSDKVKIPSQSGCICTYKDYLSAVASSSSGTMTIINENLDLIQIQTKYRGITNISSIDDKILLTASLSCMPRLIDPSGKEIRAFLGHCANVQGISLISPTTFASRADDYTVRIWDIRKREAAMTITSLHNSIINISGSPNFVVVAFHKKIGVVDIRGSSPKPILGITTEDYDAASLKYNQQDDCLAMFGVVEKENNKDSMLFIGGDGQSRQRIFRMYNDFVGIQNE